MLQVKNISKEYRTGNFVQKALDGVSVSLRDNEFVAILGPSGSGKTTLLNIIGGLDRYDSGDLVINHISTKKYKDRDWDSYRNHTIGFVFQSYNLIPHQSVLKNVELALTIGGIPRAEKKKRAEDALIRVGLGDHMLKKPNQLSGGQMQRVAIARALVNNPDILLADEPTGALDSDTSIQVMDLLKEVASDRLVIMVTHNPDLANQYANRIITLKDGKITSDSNPYVVNDDQPAVHKNLGRAAMSFFTSLGLSFNNLLSKLTRTVLIAFAGSIGIIGIAMILALSTGVNDYIKKTEEETLKEYPLSISSMSIDLNSILQTVQGDREAKEGAEVIEVSEARTITTLFSGFAKNDLRSLKQFIENEENGILSQANAIEYKYGVTPLIYTITDDSVRQVNPDTLMSAVGYTSTSGSFGSLFSSYTNTDIFSAMPAEESLFRDQYDVKAGRWPEAYNELVLVLTRAGTVSDIALYDMNLKDHTELSELIKKFLTGEIMEITSPLGMYRYNDFLGIEFSLVNPADCYVFDSEYGVFTLKSDDPVFMRTLVESSEKLTIVGVVQAKDETSIAMLDTGIAYPASLVYHCIEETAGREVVIRQIENPEIDVVTGKPFGTNEKGSLDLASLFSVDVDALKEMFSFNVDELTFELPDLSEYAGETDLSSLVSPADFAGINISIPEIDFMSLLSSIKIDPDEEELKALFSDLLDSYQTYISEDPSVNITNLPEALRAYMNDESSRTILSEGIDELLAKVRASMITDADVTALVATLVAGYETYAEKTGLSDEDRTAESVLAYLNSDEGKELIRSSVQALIEEKTEAAVTDEDIRALSDQLLAGYDAFAAERDYPVLSRLNESFGEFVSREDVQERIGESLSKIVDTTELEEKIREIMNSATSSVASSVSKAMSKVLSKLTDRLTGLMGEVFPAVMESVMEQISSGFNFDAESLAKVVGAKISDEELKELMNSLLSTDVSTYSGNLSKFGYASLDEPSSISIYPIDFESKGRIKDVLDRYNEEVVEAGEKDRKITYTDLVGVLMSSVTEIINSISIVLIAFVAISLVVSSIMIGVITYISVLERKKEIGILRALGASKRNISQVFNAETIIIGALAGLFGVIITEILLIPTNIIIYQVSGHYIHAMLPTLSAFILVALSTVLTLIGGLIPSQKASRSDPVTALRTE